MMAGLPEGFFDRPFAHRGRHDGGRSVPENSLAGAVRAIAEGWGIEIDVQLSSDGEAMVFHDYALDRLTSASGPVRQRSADELSGIRLKGGEGTIPRLPEFLTLVGGRVPVVIEIKDQDGALGPNVGPLETSVADAVRGYDGPLAVMSFNPHSVAKMAELSPDVPRGLTTEAFPKEGWAAAEARLADLRTIPDYERVGASFISHDWHNLRMPRVAELKRAGAKVLCWTIKSAGDAATALRVADQITFEGYDPEG